MFDFWPAKNAAKNSETRGEQRGEKRMAANINQPLDTSPQYTNKRARFASCFSPRVSLFFAALFAGQNSNMYQGLGLFRSFSPRLSPRVSPFFAACFAAVFRVESPSVPVAWSARAPFSIVDVAIGGIMSVRRLRLSFGRLELLGE